MKRQKERKEKLSWRRCSWSHHFYDCALANDKLCGHSQLPCATLKMKKKKDTIIKWNSEKVIECFQWTIILVSSLLKKLCCVKDRPNHNIGQNGTMMINTALRDNVNNYISVHPWCLQINLYKADASQSKILPLSLLKDISLIQSIVAMAFLRIKQWQQYFRLITTFYGFIVVFTAILSYLVSLLSSVTNAISMRKDQQSKKKKKLVTSSKHKPSCKSWQKYYKKTSTWKVSFSNQHK